MSEPLLILAAGSLRPAFDRLASRADCAIRITYANARDLARMIEAGELADVFASASEEHPRLLHLAGLAHPARPLASNRLVVAVAQASAAREVGVLAADGTRLVIEVAGIPLGDYTRAMLERMDEVDGTGFAARALGNVVFEEQVVDAVAERLLRGDADAGVLYATDVAARSPALRAIELPTAAAVEATYVACVMTAAPQPERAAEWVEGLTGDAAQEVLRATGFASPG